MIKRLLTALITILLVLPFTGSLCTVEAAERYSMSCSAGEFEVSYIENDGSLTKVSCHSSLYDAKKVMKTNKDYVVRYGKSYSPTKIVAMNSGLVYSYPARRGSLTINLYQNPEQKDNSKYKTTYVEEHYEMTYVDTCGPEIYDIASAGKGYVQVVLNGFEGFTDLEYTDLVPSKYIDNGIAIWLGGNCASEDEFLVKVHQNYYQIEANGNYYDMVFHYHKAYGTGGKDCLSYSLHTDNAKNYLDAGMKAGVKYYSNDGINFYSDSALTKKVARVYNYYQFLPIRSKTNISASALDSFMKDMKGSASVFNGKGSVFIDNQNAYGCNALIIYAMACQESAYGTSGYAVNRNNLFGWSAYDDSPNDASYFSSVANCVKEHMGRNLYWFADYTNSRYFGTCVGNKGTGFNVKYASDPYWGEKIAAIAYQIDKFANNKNGKLSDYNAYTIGLVDDYYNDYLYSSSIKWDSKIYTDPTGNTELYTARFGSHYQKDLTVIVLEKTGDRYKIQSTNAVKNKQIITDDGVIPYDWDKSVGYVNASSVTLLNKAAAPETPNVPLFVTYEHLVSLREVNLTSDSLKLKGVGAIQGMNFSTNKDIKHEIIFKSLSNPDIVYTFEATNIDSDGFEYNDNCDYKYAGFEITVPLSSLPKDSYTVRLKTTNGQKNAETYLSSSEVSYRVMSSKNNDFIYRITMNDSINYRFDLDIISNTELDFTKINKYSARSSLVTLDSFLLEENGDLTINAHAYMYYLNYDNINNIGYDVYLIDSKDNYLKLNTSIVDDGIDYKKELQSNYNLDHISFKATTVGLDKNTFDLSGEYTVYVKQTNGNYLDICEMTDYGFDFNTVETQTKRVKLYGSSIRSRIMLSAQDLGD